MTSKNISRPNVLFIFADQLRASSVGYTGQENVKTPHIDNFAINNSYFKTAVSMMPVCGPYRACLMTGRTPTSTGQIINDIPLGFDEISIGRIFKAEKYDTAYVGKWHLNGPNRPGPVLPEARHGWDHWMGANFEHNYSESRFTDNEGNEKTWKGYDAESQTDEVIKFLRNRSSENPFCMFLSWGPPHHPYREAPKEYLDLYDPKLIKGRPNCPNVPDHDLWGYYAQTTFLDDQFGRLLGELDRLQLDKNTIVIFTSDHGDMHGSHGVYKKQWPWNESILVPFSIRYPGIIPKNQRLEFPISVIDIFPTLLGLCKIGIPDSIEGRNLAPFICGDRDDPPESVLIMNPCPFSIGDPRSPDQVPDYLGRRMEYRGVISDRYTYVHTIEGPWLLYDNLIDPYQVNNLVDNIEYKALKARLEGLMRKHMAKIDDEILPKEDYYKKFNLKLDHRGKLANLVENMYNRAG
ncbi:sulfatase [Paracoccaceae bacterium]|nr:sulfatase [Paracoccaceae bacterium]